MALLIELINILIVYKKDGVTCYQLRGPYLARFELCVRLKAINKDPIYLLGDTFELFIEYFRKFGHKSCCVSDLRIYLDLLTVERKIELSEEILKFVGVTTTVLPETEIQMQRHICALQLSRLCNPHRNLDENTLELLTEQLIIFYKHGVKNFNGQRLITDQGSSDAYILLAVHILYDLAVKKCSSKPVINALIILESLLRKSPSNFHAKLLCVRLYHFIGAGEGAQKMYESLDTKHLQMDSLAFIHCNCLYTTGLMTLTCNIFDGTLKFFTSNYRDSIDHLTFSYKFGSFLKLNEFIEFRERLNNSVNYIYTSIDRIMLECIMGGNNLKNLLTTIDLTMKTYHNINWKNLCDNNNYEVYVNWNCIEFIEYYQKRYVYKRNVLFFKMRSILIEFMCESLKMKRDEELRNLYEKWLEVVNEVENCWKEDGMKEVEEEKYFMWSMVSRLNGLILLPFRLIYGVMLRFVRTVLCCSKKGGDIEEMEMEEFFKGIDEVRNVVCFVIKKKKEEDDDEEEEDTLWCRRRGIETVFNCVEMLSVCCILIGICNEFLNPIKQQNVAMSASTATTTNNKKSNKKIVYNNNVEEKEEVKKNMRKMVKCMGNVLRICCERILGEVNEWDVGGEFCKRFEEMLKIIEVEKEVNVVRENVRISHCNMKKELRSVLCSKIKFLEMC